jgi:hypothetical protein
LEVKDHTVVGIAVISNAVGSSTGSAAGIGYGISGVDHPGVYLDVANMGRDYSRTPGSQAYPYPKTVKDAYGVNQTLKLGVPLNHDYPNIARDDLLTPWGCPYAGYSGNENPPLCGQGNPIYSGVAANINGYDMYYHNVESALRNWFYTGPNKMAYIQIRSFEFAEGAGQPQYLPNPLWLAAKYGGFRDTNKNGEPDEGEWDSERKGIPDNYFEVANIGELPAQLGKAFNRISKAGEAVTATADSITSVLGGGLAIETSYVPEYTSSQDAGLDSDKRVKIKWVGNAFSLFIDQWGNLREDTNQNGILDVVTGPSNPNGGDRVVIFENQLNSDNAQITLWSDELGTNDLAKVDTVYSLYDIKPVWDAADLLSGITDASLETPRVFSDNAIGRRLYSYAGAVPDPSAGFASAVRLNNDHLFSVARADAYAPLLGQGYTLSNPVTIAGPEPCDLLASRKCGPEHAPCQEIHLSAVGKPPHDITSIRVVIDNFLTPGQVTSAVDGSHVLVVRVGRTTAKGVVNSLNDFIFDQHVSHMIRAHLNSGDLGNWYPSTGTAVTLPTMANAADRKATLENLIRYTYGADVRGWRSRAACAPGDTTGKTTWRLGDLINSKPVIVAEPSSAYDLLYGDQSFSNFKKNYPDDASSPGVRSRRIIAYMGSNDGILHAFNLGFYGSLDDGTIGYSKKTFPRDPSDPLSNPSAVQHELGTELWGYIPTSVLPHLTWASDPEYEHSYYVDLEPMIVDIKNTSNASVPLGGGKTWAVGEWRTVLIGGLRLGGRTIELDNDDSPVKYLYSEYFALDVTDPEEEPALLWRFSHQDLGLTVTKPAVVSSRDGWHVLVGSGPTTDLLDSATQTKVPAGSGGELAYGGVSNQKARVFVLNAYNGTLQKVMGGDGDAFMPQGQSIPGNSFFNNSFVVASVGPGSSSLVTQGASPGSVDWHNPSVYFGLTVSRDANRIDSGALYRVQMVNSDGTPAPVSDWKLTTMYKTDRPVTGAVNATFDSLGNMWVVFGTGRLWSEEDRSPTCSLLQNAARQAACEDNHVQYLYGLKEPMNNGLLTYAEIKESGASKIADVTEAKVFEDGTVLDYPGLGTTTYTNVLQLMGSGSYIGYKRGLNIWAFTNSNRSFTNRTYEMILSQPKLDPLPNGRSTLVVTTYEPSTELCDPEGHSYLYLTDTWTGLPAPYMAPYNFTQPSESTGYTISAPGTDAQGQPKRYRMITGYLSAGQGQATEAWIIKSDNATIYGDTSANQVQNKIVLANAVDGFTTGILWWREVLDMGLSLGYDDLIRGLPSSYE